MMLDQSSNLPSASFGRARISDGGSHSLRFWFILSSVSAFRLRRRLKNHKDLYLEFLHMWIQ